MNKFIKVLAVIFWLIGLTLILLTVGTDDYYVMQLHQEPSDSWLIIILGCILCIPLPIVLNRKEKK